jgi:effector-binding domain-containing protein
MLLSYSGPKAGAGSSLKWVSQDKNIGTGSLTIISSAPNDSVRVIIDFMNHGKSAALFKLTRSGTKTKVSWSLESDLGMNPLSRWIGLFSNQLIGPDLEKGLSELDLLVMGSKKVDGFEILDFEVPARVLVSVRDTASAATIAVKLTKMYKKLSVFLNSRNLPPTGSPIAVFHAFSGNVIDIEACIPIATVVVAPEGLFCSAAGAQKTIMTNYVGPYRYISAAYNAVQKYIDENDVRVTGPIWEEYLTRPGLLADTNRWQTNIYFPVD